MVGLDNPLHLVFLLVILLLIFGAKRLPEMGRSLGSGLRGFKDSFSGQTPLPAEHEPMTEHKVELPEAVEMPGVMHESTQAQVADELETPTAA
jgi:sec-independent protein translocase protein TatA